MFTLKNTGPNEPIKVADLYEDPESSDEDHKNHHLNESAEIVNEYLTKRTLNNDDEGNNLLDDFDKKVTQRDYDEKYSVQNNLSVMNDSFTESAINNDIEELDGVKKDPEMHEFKYSPSKNTH